jgi:hypothetical protein
MGDASYFLLATAGAFTLWTILSAMVGKSF